MYLRSGYKSNLNSELFIFHCWDNTYSSYYSLVLFVFWIKFIRLHLCILFVVIILFFNHYSSYLFLFCLAVLLFAIDFLDNCYGNYSDFLLGIFVILSYLLVLCPIHYLFYFPIPLVFPKISKYFFVSVYLCLNCDRKMLYQIDHLLFINF